MTTHSVLSGVGGVLLALSIASVTSAAAKNGHQGDAQAGVDRAGVSDASSYAALGACRLSSGSHFQLSRGHNPFRRSTGGGSYGDVFFAGGASTRVKTPSTHAGESASSPPVVGGGAGHPPSSNNGNGPTSPGSGSSSPNAGRGTSTEAGEPAAHRGSDSDAELDNSPTAGGNPAGGSGGGGGTTTPTHVGSTIGASAAVNPEPTTLLLIGTGVGGLLIRRRASRSRRDAASVDSRESVS